MSETTVKQTVLIVREKSVALAVVLGFFFGPFGVLYASLLAGGLSILGVFLLSIVTGGLGGLFVWVFFSILGGVLVSNKNKKLREELLTK